MVKLIMEIFGVPVLPASGEVVKMSLYEKISLEISIMTLIFTAIAALK